HVGRQARRQLSTRRRRMLSAIDTNAISALWSQEPAANRLAEWLNRARLAGGMVICPVVQAELRAHPTVDDDFVLRFLADTRVRVDFDMSERVWDRAGSAFAAYAARRLASGGGEPKRLLADFIVGAHALERADRLLTLDGGRY